VTQTLSVLLVTVGVIITTLSASIPSRSRSDKPPLRNHSPHSTTYVTGVSILTVALFLSGFLGILQDWTYSRYGRPSLSATSSSKHYNDPAKDPPPSWQESMFYLHFLALPMFLSIRHDLASQFRIINAGPTVTLSLISITSTRTSLFSFPQAYVPLLLNTLTQLLCVAGVHRLTTRVSALTVTLVLVVRKAASFIISVLWLQGAGKRVADDGEGVLTLRMIWFGAALVLVGTVGYSVGSDSKGVKNANSSLYSVERTDKGGKIE
jgi:solute carrier family 35 (UDP-xylose/UDP-N-acetylglucosamine transporter), member B4